MLAGMAGARFAGVGACGRANGDEPGAAGFARRRRAVPAEAGGPSRVRDVPELGTVADGQEARTGSAAFGRTTGAGALARQTRRAFTARSSSSV